MPSKNSEVDAEAIEAKVRAAEAAFQTAARDYEGLPNDVAKGARITAFHQWNDAARSYFTACIEAFRCTKPPTAFSTVYAADWLREVVGHYRAVKRESGKNELDFEALKPKFLKFAELQEYVKENDPLVSRDLQREFAELGLATYGFEEQPHRQADDTRKAAEALRWFGFGCVLFVVAVGFAGWGFYLGGLTEPQRHILLWILPLSSGFAAGAFAGSITAKARHAVPGFAIVATGGFAVWVLTSLILFPSNKPASAATGASGPGVTNQAGGTSGPNSNIIQQSGSGGQVIINNFSPPASAAAVNEPNLRARATKVDFGKGLAGLVYRQIVVSKTSVPTLYVFDPECKVVVYVSTVLERGEKSSLVSIAITGEPIYAKPAEGLKHRFDVNDPIFKKAVAWVLDDANLGDMAKSGKDFLQGEARRGQRAIAQEDFEAIIVMRGEEVRKCEGSYYVDYET